LRVLLPLAAAAAMAALDARRRAALAAAAYGIALLALYGWSTGQSPAFAPLVPTPAETALALALAALAGALGGAAGRRIADALEPSAPAATSTLTRPLEVAPTP
jgi:hypothetical protein